MELVIPPAGLTLDLARLRSIYKVNKPKMYRDYIAVTCDFEDNNKYRSHSTRNRFNLSKVDHFL
jgi:hypothetical protein